MKKLWLIGLLALAIVAGSAGAETIVLQQGVSPDASYEHDMAMVVGDNLTGWGAGAIEFYKVGARWQQATQWSWGIVRYDLSPIPAGSTINSATWTITCNDADCYDTNDTGAGHQPDLFWHDTQTMHLYQVRPENYEWIEGTGASEGANGLGEVAFEVMAEDVACWTYSGCTLEGLYPEGWGYQPVGGTNYNVSGVISDATANMTWDDLRGGSVFPTVDFVFNTAGVAYLQDVVDGTINDAGFLMAPPDETISDGPDYYVVFGIHTDDFTGDTSYRPKLTVDYTAPIPTNVAPDPEMPVAGALGLGLLAAATAIAGICARKK